MGHYDSCYEYDAKYGFDYDEKIIRKSKEERHKELIKTMARFDHGGGCPCGLQKECDCNHYSNKNKEVKKEKDWKEEYKKLEEKSDALKIKYDELLENFLRLSSDYIREVINKKK